MLSALLKYIQLIGKSGTKRSHAALIVRACSLVVILGGYHKVSRSDCMQSMFASEEIKLYAMFIINSTTMRFNFIYLCQVLHHFEQMDTAVIPITMQPYVFSDTLQLAGQCHSSQSSSQNEHGIYHIPAVACNVHVSGIFK